MEKIEDYEGGVIYVIDKGKRGELFVWIKNNVTYGPYVSLKIARETVKTHVSNPGGGGAATWGSITGDISDNAELTAELDKKAGKAGSTFTGEVIVNSDKPVLGYRQIRAGKDLSWGLNSAGDFLLWDNKRSKTIVRVVPDYSYVQIGDVAHTCGTGQPNGRFAAPPGSTYTDTAVTCGAVKWVKMWGTGNTGWTVLYGDTGWRDIKSLLDPFWDNTSNIQLRRINKVVYFRTNGIKVAANTTTSRTALARIIKKDQFPLGFRNSGWGTAHAFVNIGGQPGAVYSFEGTFDFAIRGIPGTGNWTKGDSCSFNLSYVTENDWPTTLPGGVSG
nr:MAG TPA: hypothetical protein [Caudoviricetes sp.]